MRPTRSFPVEAKSDRAAGGTLCVDAQPARRPSATTETCQGAMSLVMFINAQAERRAQRVRSSLLFGGIPVTRPSWQQLERPRQTRTDSDCGKVAAIRCQHSVDVPSLSDCNDCPIDQPQVELRESGVELEGANNVGG